MFGSMVPRIAKVLGVSDGLIWLCSVVAVIAIVVGGASSGGPLAVAMFFITFVVPLGLASAFQRRRSERESG
jgi:hypothetical protein